MEHRRGKLNVIPDALSRVFSEELNGINFSEEHFNDAGYLDLCRKLEKDSSANQNTRVENGKIYRNVLPNSPDDPCGTNGWRLWVPKSVVNDLFRQYQDHPSAAHPGIAKTSKLFDGYFTGQVCLAMSIPTLIPA